MAKKEKRFHIQNDQKADSWGIGTYVIVDKKTGVNYLFAQSGYSGGLTPLLNRDGTPIVTTVIPDEED